MCPRFTPRLLSPSHAPRLASPRRTHDAYSSRFIAPRLTPALTRPAPRPRVPRPYQVHDRADDALALVRRVCPPAHLAVLDYLFAFLNDLAQYAMQTR